MQDFHKNGSRNNTSASLENCSEWMDAQQTLYQAANVFYAASFLIPHTFKSSILLTRTLMCLGYSMLILWALFDVCAPDVFAWNSVFVVVNLIHIVYLSCHFYPPRIRRHVLDFYNKVFVPLNIEREAFVQLIRDSALQDLATGREYFTERQHCNRNERILSILLTGKLKVTFRTTLLHHIYPHQFIDSPEWYMQLAFPNNSNASIPQVTITAVEPSTFLYWTCDKLKQLLSNNPDLAFLLDCLIGKDVSHKLYSVAEHVSLEKMKLSPRFGGSSSILSTHSPLGPWEHELLRSQSADAVHTCKQGQVRSLHWRRQQTRLLWRRRYEKLVPVSNETTPYGSPSRSRTRRCHSVQAAHDEESKDSPSPTSRTIVSLGKCENLVRTATNERKESPISETNLSPRHCSIRRAQHNWNKVKFETFV